MKHLCLLLSCSLLAACAGTETQKVTPEEAYEEEVKSEIISDILNDKLKKNGKKLLCDQSEYRKCYDISQLECEEDMGQFNDRCLSTAEDKVGKIKYGDNVEQFGRIYAVCLAVNHLVLHKDSAAEISGCLQEAELDSTKAAESLLK